jgi:hypothetical protein
MAAQFAGPLVFAYLIFVNVIIWFEFYLLFLIAGVAVGILIAVHTPKSEAAVPNAIDRLSLILNILLIPVYFVLSVIMLFMAMITKAQYDAGPTMELFARILSFTIAAAPIYCGIIRDPSASP